MNYTEELTEEVLIEKISEQMPLILINILFEKGLINPETYKKISNRKENKNVT